MNPALMTIILILSISLFCWSMFRRFLPLALMQPDPRQDRLISRLYNMVKYALCQSRFFKRFELIHGLAHVLIFWGFLAVSLNSIHLIGRGFVIDWSLPGLHETTLGLAYVFLKDLFVLAVMIGCLAALLRRLIIKPERMTLSWEANLILVWIFVMMLLDIIYSSTLFTLFPNHPEAKTSFLGAFGLTILDFLNLGREENSVVILYNIGFWGHVVLIMGFANYLPYGKHFHVILSLPGVFFSNPENKNQLSKQDFDDEDAIFGVSGLEEFSWKRAIDMYNCTECGRCQINCPAYLSEKPLSPKKLIINERNHLKQRTPAMMRAGWLKLIGKQEESQKILEADEGRLMTGEVITDEEIWSCTTCGHCTENCPVLIEHVPNIIDQRRYLVQVESRIPRELATVFKGWENMSNPWTVAANTRGDWFQNLNVKTPEEHPEFEYLYYVGCAGSFDNRNVKVSTAFVRLMQLAEVSFACLGNEETCCGETARRLGSEYTAQSMIEANVALWKELGVKKIVTTCPHCFNTLKNEYPQFEGKYEVLSHIDLINQLILQGKLQPKNGSARKTPIVYHDSCYLGRYNHIYDIPRQIVNAVPGVELVEPERTGRTSFCCGAGGGRMWIDENIGTRINSMRCEQLLETGAKSFAVACPYCLTMLDDSIKDKGLEEEYETLDLAEIVYRSISHNTSS